MTGRDKIELAFSPNGAPDIPAVICYEGIYYRDRWDDVTSCPWWYAHSNDLDEQLAWRADAIERLNQDWFVVPMCASRDDRAAVTVSERPDGVYRTDARTGESEKIERPPLGGHSLASRMGSVRPEALAATTEEIDELLPLPADAPEDITESGRDDLAKMLLGGAARDLYPVYYIGSPFWALSSLWGFEGMMIMTATRRDLVRYATERALARAVHAVRQAALLGARAVWIEECLTDMISPSDFRDLNLPLLRAMVDAAHAARMKAIYYYCGNPADRWEHLFATGADALSLEEGKKGWTVDIDEVVDRAGGRCAVLGNLDAINLLPNASEDVLRHEVSRQLAAGRRNGGRFIMSIGSPVTPATPASRVRLYTDLVHEG